MTAPEKIYIHKHCLNSGTFYNSVQLEYDTEYIRKDILDKAIANKNKAIDALVFIINNIHLPAIHMIAEKCLDELGLDMTDYSPTSTSKGK